MYPSPWKRVDIMEDQAEDKVMVPACEEDKDKGD
jgi:hypothetical protein